MRWSILYSLPQGIYLHQNFKNKFLNMHASSYEQPPRTPKYSQISSPIKILIGGMEESHTKEKMLKISAEMMCCGRRSKFAAKSTKNSGSSKKLGIFRARERERERERETAEEDLPGKVTWWAQAAF